MVSLIGPIWLKTKTQKKGVKLSINIFSFFKNFNMSELPPNPRYSLALWKINLV